MTRSRSESSMSRRTFSARAAAGVAAVPVAAGLVGGLSPAIAFAQDKTEIRMATYTISESWDAMITTMIDAFNAQSTTTSVKLEFRPGDQYWDKLQTEYAGGQAPDITLNQSDWVVPGASREMFVDLSPLYERDAVDLSDLWYDTSREWGYEGGIYGGLLYAGGQALYVNKGLLEAAGEALPAAGWTWDDLLASALKLTDASKNQFGIMLSLLSPPYWSCSFIHGAGGTVLNDARDECTLNSAESRAALQWLVDLSLIHKVMPISGSTEGQENPFLTGKIAYYFGGTWDETAIRTSGIDWDFLPMPAHPTTGLRNVQLGSNAWSILSTTSNEDAAWEVIKFITGPEGSKQTMSAGIPGYNSVINSPEFLALHQPQDIGIAIKDFIEIGHDYYPTPDSGEWWGAADQELAPMWTGEDTVESSTQRATDRINEIFSQRGSF